MLVIEVEQWRSASHILETPTNKILGVRAVLFRGYFQGWGVLGS